MDKQVQQRRLQGRLEPEIKTFRQQRKTVQIATVDEQGRPNVSYAPYVQNKDGFFVLISKIARHANNLLVNPAASIMLIEDEDNAKHLFARKRLTFDSTATIVERESEQWQVIIAQMRERFGDIIDGLSQFQDFILFHFSVDQGLYVKGFGQAYQVSAANTVDIIHLEEGHKELESA
ncbi:MULTISPECIES: heme utilization protein HutZ [Vibrio]|uniref:HugZ protein n=2 Tax=Vibrio TaxID=662 RepID=A0A0A5HXX7_PHOS4|nr:MULTISPECIES: heme utilization protein HutZ [Vibrio]KGY08354.1 HugZ protein [Vibrio sinaloensis]KHA60769.1 HugZ protein [Vibrio variabilis]KIE21131.1 HugZ protein [Vibrio sinaloensis]